MVFAAIHESGPGPKRQLAAVQRYGRCRWNTGRSVDAASTAGSDPKETLASGLARKQGAPPATACRLFPIAP